MDEQRIIELETRIAYQEHTISELNNAVADQQQQLTRLMRVLESLTARLAVMAEMMPEADSPQNEQPPHY
ncbi:MAG: SlyX family protein [Woeseia sp.]|nr:SlyX family protein [Woeseia sp.]MBT8097169.1 SlyX family protein [Woeseia sp.]NNE60093.1 SlyX family protein [Woeseia sp.]NNL56008.1 SlyX family protein [Woeseia sp.]